VSGCPLGYLSAQRYARGSHQLISPYFRSIRGGSLYVGSCRRQLLNVQVPFYFKSIVDSMNIDFVAIGGTAYTVAGSMIIAYGVTRIGATIFQEIRNAVFATVAQKAIRGVACSVYDHLLRLDLNFHLTRQTGGLTRAIDRGTKGISFLLTSMVFHIIPTALEIGLVCGILVCCNAFSNSLSLSERGQNNSITLDIPLRIQICRHYRIHYGSLLGFHYHNNCMAHKVPKTSQCC